MTPEVKGKLSTANHTSKNAIAASGTDATQLTPTQSAFFGRDSEWDLKRQMATPSKANGTMTIPPSIIIGRRKLTVIARAIRLTNYTDFFGL
jgi:hypothetical protein